MEQTVTSRTKVFVSYSHKDAAALERLQVHLKPHVRAGALDLWADTRIQPGQAFDREIRSALASARIAVLLISADFYASDYITGIEVPAVLEAAEAGDLVVLCILLSPSAFLRDRSLSRVQAVNDPKTPVFGMSPIDQEALWARVAEEVVRHLPPETPIPPPVPPPVLPPESAPVLSQDSVPPIGGAAPVGGAAPRGAVFGVPFARNVVYTGREDVLKRVASALWGRRDGRYGGEGQEGQEGQEGRRLRIAALSGLGGIGKTQTALEYAWRHRDRYTGVFWVLADTETSLREGYAEIARFLNLPEKAAPEQERAVHAVKRWLEENGGWLLILDNADEIETARRYFPARGHGHMLLTTRAGVIGPGMTVVSLHGMGLEEGATLLLRRAGRLEVEGRLEEATAADREAALAISGLVGGLPLALDQAGAYILNRQRTPADYRDRYMRERTKLLGQPGGDGPGLQGPVGEGHGRHDPVTITFSLAFGRLASDSAGADLVRACAYLAPDAIPDELFHKGAPALGGHLCAVGEDEDAWDGAVAEATRYSLLRRDPDAHTLSLHRLVQSVLQDGMSPPERRTWRERCVRALALAFPDPEFQLWDLCERLLPHALVGVRWVEEESFEDTPSADLLLYTATYLGDRGRYEEAEPLLEHALAIREKNLGAWDPGTADCLTSLAVNCFQRRDYNRTEELLRRALHIREEALGMEHPKVAESLSNLASVNQHLDRHFEEESLHLRAVHIQEVALGMEHPDTALSLNNLAVFYHSQNRPEEAEPLFQRALAVWEKTLGPRHPYTTLALHNLGVLCFEGGRCEEAHAFYERALSAREQTVGPAHPDTLATMRRLRDLYRQQARDREAEALEARFPESQGADAAKI